jgi:hypothetical protein
MKAKEIFLLILIIAVGITFYYAQTGKINWNFDWDEGFFFGHEEFVYEETQEITAPFPPEIQVTNSHGTVEIHGTDEERITIDFKKRIWRKDEETADEVAERLKMIIDKDESLLAVSTNRGDFKKRRFKTYFKISVPSGMQVKVKNSYGMVKTLNVKDTDISNRHGEVIAADISGDLFIKNGYEDIEVNTVLGSCQIDSTHADITAYDVQGTLQVDLGYGDVYLENVKDNVIVKGTHNKVHAQSLQGKIEIDNSYERVTLFDVGEAVIRGNHSPIEIDGVEGDVDIRDKYSKATITNIQGNLKVEGKSLKVYAKTIQGEKVSVSTTYEDVELLEFSGQTTITLSHGKVYLDPYPLSFPVDVRGEYSDIIFYWPEGEKYPFEARNKGGNIEWKLSETPSYQEENSLSVIKAFVEEQDRPSIFLSTSHGKIKIER